MRRLGEAGKAFQESGFAGAVGSDQAEAVALADDEVQVPEQGRVGNDADIAKAEGSHGWDLWCSAPGPEAIKARKSLERVRRAGSLRSLARKAVQS